MVWKIKTTKDRITKVPTNTNSNNVQASFDVYDDDGVKVFGPLDVNGDPSDIEKRMKYLAEKKKAEYMQEQNFKQDIEVEID